MFKLNQVLPWNSSPSKAKTENRYVYGIVQSEDSLPQGNFELISLGDLHAITRIEKEQSLNQLSKQKLGRYLLHHQQVIEGIMAQFPIIPMKLGTYLADEAAVNQLLTQVQAHHRSWFELADGFVEMNFIAAWQKMDGVLAEVSESPEVLNYKNELNAKGSISFKERLKLGQIVQQQVLKHGQALNQTLSHRLLPFHQGIQNHALAKDEIVLNSAFLVPKSQLEAFNNEIEDIDEVWGEQMNFRLVGPLPLYSFYCLQIESLDKADIQDAMESLGIETVVDQAQIKQGFRNQVQQIHPDMLQKDGEEEPGVLTNLKDARRILLDFIANGYQYSLLTGTCTQFLIVSNLHEVTPVSTNEPS